MSCVWGIFDAMVSLTETHSVTEPTPVERPKTAPGPEKKDPSYFEDRSSGNIPLPADQTQVIKLAIAQLVYSLITLAGAVLMFRLRRIGFWIYVAGIAAGLVLPIVLAGFWCLEFLLRCLFQHHFRRAVLGHAERDEVRSIRCFSVLSDTPDDEPGLTKRNARPQQTVKTNKQSYSSPLPSVLLTNATRLLSGDQEGVLMVP